MKIIMRRVSMISYSRNHGNDNAVSGVFLIKMNDFNQEIVLDKDVRTMVKQKIQSSTPGQTANNNCTDVIKGNSEKTQNGFHQIFTQSKSHPRETNMEKKENLAIEFFWKEALKADSLLLWIVVNSRLASEG